MFEGFELTYRDTGEASLRVRYGGEGPPRLHGHPQMHVCWYKVTPRLAQDFFVVCLDLHGYGASSKPPTASENRTRKGRWRATCWRLCRGWAASGSRSPVKTGAVT